MVGSGAELQASGFGVQGIGGIGKQELRLMDTV